LEDVSHLFLSQANQKPAAEQEMRRSPSEQARAQPPEPPPVAVLRSVPAPDREQVVSLLKDNPALLEEGLRMIDVNLPVVPGAPIDLLALDSSCRLVVVDIDTSTRDSLLVRGIYHIGWLVGNVPLLRRMYRTLLIDYDVNPRVFLVAPDYSNPHRSATSWISTPEIKCFKYRTVVLRGVAGILVEPA